MLVNLGIFAFGLAMAPMFEAGSAGVVAAIVLGMSLVGLAYGPLGTVLSELFPTSVRYTGSSLAFNLAGIFGASLAPYVATGSPPATGCSGSATTYRPRLSCRSSVSISRRRHRTVPTRCCRRTGNRVQHMATRGRDIDGDRSARL